MSLVLNMVGGGGKAKLYTNYEYSEEQITDVSGFTKLYDVSKPYGNYGNKVSARLAVTDESAIEELQSHGWDYPGMCYYDSEDKIGAYAGYNFGQEILISKAKFWIGRFSGQNKTLIATVQYLDSGGNWHDVQDLEVKPNISYPINVFEVDIGEFAHGIRWYHYKRPTKTSNNNITFAGMSVYKPLGSPIPVYKPNTSGLIMPPTGYDGFGPLLINVEDMQNALNILGVTE